MLKNRNRITLNTNIWTGWDKYYRKKYIYFLPKARCQSGYIKKVGVRAI